VDLSGATTNAQRAELLRAAAATPTTTTASSGGGDGTGIGGIVKQDRPAKGAGNIESPGAQDQYTFHAGEGQEVYLDVQECTSDGTLTWTLPRPDEQAVFKDESLCIRGSLYDKGCSPCRGRGTTGSPSMAAATPPAPTTSSCKAAGFDDAWPEVVPRFVGGEHATMRWCCWSSSRWGSRAWRGSKLIAVHYVNLRIAPMSASGEGCSLLCHQGTGSLATLTGEFVRSLALSHPASAAAEGGGAP
jgi:hypothetical protein